jgi:hypothetical protein
VLPVWIQFVDWTGSLRRFIVTRTCRHSGADLVRREIDARSIQSLRGSGSMVDVYVCIDFECIAENHEVDL